MVIHKQKDFSFTAQAPLSYKGETSRTIFSLLGWGSESSIPRPLTKTDGNGFIICEYQEIYDGRKGESVQGAIIDFFLRLSPASI